MRRQIISLVVAMLASIHTAQVHAQSKCSHRDGGLTPQRVVEIDTSAGPIYGAYTKRDKEPSFLGSKEVVLTFDDGPMPWITRSILATLDDYCTKATFFSVGRMALAYPDVVRDIVDNGHTLGTHTMTHPFNMHRMDRDRAHDQIDRGFAAVTVAAGVAIAPFFRFPGLADSDELLTFLQHRQIAAFTVDVISDDSFIADPGRLADTTLRRIEQNNGGIILFHDIKRSTAKALPTILARLQTRGYRIVHMIPKTYVQPAPALLSEMADALAKMHPRRQAQTLMPFYGTAGPSPAVDPSSQSERAPSDAGTQLIAPITALSPVPRDRKPMASEHTPHAMPTHAPRRSTTQSDKKAHSARDDRRRRSSQPSEPVPFKWSLQ